MIKHKFQCMKNKYITFVILCLVISSCNYFKHNRIYDKKQFENKEILATEILLQDFLITKRVLQILEKASYCLDEGEQVSKETFDEIIEVINEFSDKCHREKEEKILFPFLKDIKENGKIDFLCQLLMEHVTARELIRNLSELTNKFHQGKKARKKISKVAHTYIKHMRKHIQTEEKVLFPWINKVLTPDDHVLLIKKFEEMNQEEYKSGLYENYVSKIEDLEKQLQIYLE